MASKSKKTEYEQELEAQVAQLTDALQRERADAVNLRRRHDEEKQELGSYYKVQILEGLLPAIDNLELALKHVPTALAKDNYVKGVQSVAKQFDDCLVALGLQRIATVGETFNPHVHEAIQHEEGDGENEVVSEELQAGWQIGDTVIRPAMVKVTKG